MLVEEEVCDAALCGSLSIGGTLKTGLNSAGSFPASFSGSGVSVDGDIDECDSGVE